MQREVSGGELSGYLDRETPPSSNVSRKTGHPWLFFFNPDTNKAEAHRNEDEAQSLCEPPGNLTEQEKKKGIGERETKKREALMKRIGEPPENLSKSGKMNNAIGPNQSF